ncbi:MAG: hypothetical protein JXJ04_21905, partial [Spirochaetales bacterium]|nr:hypothetical protein [Spirochaetales bacterium]
MIYLDGLKKVEKIPWRDIQPGMIFLGGIRINDTIPFELRNFPVLTSSLLDELLKKYYFLSRRDILVVKAKVGYSPSKLSGKLLEARDKIEKINAFRHAYLSAKLRIMKECSLAVSVDTSFYDTGIVDKRFLINNAYNSFNNPYSHLDKKRIPSFFHSLQSPITLGQVLTGNLPIQGNLPLDEQVLLHLVVDYSGGYSSGYSSDYSSGGYSGGMDREGKRESVFAALQLYYSYLREILKNT